MESLETINQYTRNSYNRAARKYYELFRDELEGKDFDKKVLDEYLQLLPADASICSAGCGPCGHIENYIRRKGFEISGIDISEKCIDIARENNPHIKFEIGDFANINCADNHFNGLISYYSIVDTPKIYLDKIFGEFSRVLKKNGFLLLVVKEGVHEGYEENLLGIETKIYFTLFTENDISSALERNGFEVVKMSVREPLENEIKIKRLFCIGKKLSDHLVISDILIKDIVE